MISNKDNIIFDLKIKLKSGKYLALKDNIETFDLALKEAKSFANTKNYDVYSIQIWKTKNKITTSMIHEEI